MAESQEKARDQALGFIHLLQCLGFTINREKTILEPTQCLEFLGFIVNTVSMELTLPPKKLKKIRAESRKMLGEAEQVSARALSRLIGKMNATNQVIPPAPLFYRNLQMDLTAALRLADQDYKMTFSLSPDSKEELTWWDDQIVGWNGKSMLSTEPEFVIESDASNQGWGASCQGTSTGGPWSPQEREWHFNCLELLAATLALKTFVKEKKSVSVLLKIDNTTAVAYINNQGGDGIQGVGLPNPRSLDVVFREEYSHPSTIPARSDELHSRLRVQIHEGSLAGSSYLSENRQEIRPTRSGPICLQIDLSVPSLLQLATRSIGRSD